MSRADERRARSAIKKAEFDAMLTEFDQAMGQADTLDQAARTNPDEAKGAVQASMAVSKRLKALGIMERYKTDKEGPLN